MDSSEQAQKAKPLRVVISEDQLKVLVTLPTPSDDLGAVAETLQLEMGRLEIPAFMTVDEITAWVKASLNKDGTLHHAVILEGTPPVLTVHGSIEWTDDFFSTGFKVDPETGAIDFRQRTGRSSVSEGELLGTLNPGTVGTPGKNVLGERIQVAKVRNPRLKTGKNVERKEGSNRFLATANGRVELANGRLSVSDVLVIAGDVGLESGDIDHRGSVQVERDILEDAKVTAEGDIEVFGLLEAATIDTEGNLYIRGGICGKEGVKISVAGEIHAKFILDAHIEAGGDIIVEREITHSVVKSQGCVRVPQGRIVGGTTMALGGIDVGEAGSDACVPTELIPGLDPQLDEALAESREEMQTLKLREKKIMEALQPILPVIKSLPEAKKVEVMKLVETVKQLGASIKVIEEKITTAKEKSAETAQASITIRKSLFPEVKVAIQHEHQHFKQTLSGPLKITCVGDTIKARSI